MNRVRRATGERRVGHAGTLDPMATGLLVVLVGPATRLAPYLTAAEKTYTARITFGAETDTDDAEGTVTRTAEVPAVCPRPRGRRVGCRRAGGRAPAAAAGLLGDQARRGDRVSRRTLWRGARTRAAHDRDPPGAAARRRRRDLAAGTWSSPSRRAPTFARSHATWARELGSAAHLGALRRTRSGALDVADAAPLAAIEEAGSPTAVAARFADPLRALGLPVVAVTESGAARVAAGATLDATVHCEDACPPAGEVAVAREGTLLAVYAVTGGVLRAQTVIPGGVRGGER